MKEYMLLIRNHADHQANWSAEPHQQFLKACEEYIGQLKKEGKLKIAQPLIREGKMVSGTRDAWEYGPYSEDVQCYHCYLPCLIIIVNVV